MSISSSAEKHYASGYKRFLAPSIAQFFEKNFPKLFGPEIRRLLADEILSLIEEQYPVNTRLRPGQCLWNAVAIETRADSKKLKLVPVILTLVDETDITRLKNGEPHARVAEDVTARILEEAFNQGALLSMRDIGLLTWRDGAVISEYRKKWETKNDRMLPHPGNLQDMGTCITHKTSIVAKAVYEKMSPLQVAKETRHTPQAVDRYLRDFNRVRTCYQKQPDIEFICQVTGMSNYLVSQYVEIIEKNENRHLTGNVA